MTKKTKLIPFDYHLYKAGMKAVFIDDPKIEILQIFNNCQYDGIYLVISTLDNGCTTHGYIGVNLLSLEKELEETTFYVNVYESHYSIHKDEKYADLDKEARIGKLVIHYTDEDLIK